MKAVKPETFDALEDVAVESAKQIRAFFTYQGNNTTYLNKAKLGATAISGYARLRASETNRMAIELAIQKTTGGQTARKKA